MSLRKISLVLESAGQGGTEMYVENLAAYLTKNAIEVEIIVLSGTLDEAKSRFSSHNVFLAANMWDLSNRLKKGASIASLHLYSKLLPAVIAAKRASVPIVTTLHQPLAPWSFRHRLRWRLAAAFSDINIGVSKACLQGYGVLILGKPTFVLPGPLPFNDMPQARTKHASSNPFTVAFSGRLSKEKSLPVLFEALALCTNMRLIVIGDGPEKATLKTLQTTLDLDVDFKGHMSRKDVFRALQTADAFVLPSKFEGLGLSAIEAMALGIPTIVANFPASHEYIKPDITGLSFPVGDVRALADKLITLQEDTMLAQRLSKAGSEYVRKKFTQDVQYGRYKKIFEKYKSNHPDA